MADPVDIYPPEAPAVVEVYPAAIIETVEVYGGARGPKGDPGLPGQASDEQVANSVNAYLAANPIAPHAYEFDQPIAAATWIIHHNLHFNPSVTVIDTAGTNIEGAVEYTDTDNLVVRFNAAFSGSAYLS